MNINASGRAALIIATGLFVALAGPSQAATDGDADAATSAAEAPAGAPVRLSDYTKRVSHHGKKHAHHKEARKSPSDKKTTDAADGDANNSPTVQPATIPPSVANANAQIAIPDTPAEATASVPAGGALSRSERSMSLS